MGIDIQIKFDYEQHVEELMAIKRDIMKARNLTTKEFTTLAELDFLEREWRYRHED